MSEDGRRLYVGNLDKNCHKDEVEELFVRFGKIESLWLAKQPSGFGFVIFETAEQAEDAVREMNGVEFKGHALRVEISTSDGRRKRRADGPSGPRRESRYDSYMDDRRGRDRHHEGHEARRYEERPRSDYLGSRDYGRREAPRDYPERRDYYERRPADYPPYEPRRDYYQDRPAQHDYRRERSPPRRYYDDRR